MTDYVGNKQNLILKNCGKIIQVAVNIEYAEIVETKAPDRCMSTSGEFLTCLESVHTDQCTCVCQDHTWGDLLPWR